MLPPGQSDFANAWRGLGEPTFWRDGDLGPYRSRIRVSFVTSLAHNGEAIIRIDRDASGAGHGVLIRGDGHGVRARRFFQVEREDLERLDALMAQPPLFQQFPEIWEGGVCIDGVEVVIERLNAEGYRFSEANVVCAAPQAFLDVTREIIRVSGETTLYEWVP